MTTEELCSTIRQVPGVNSARRWWGRNREERLYITWSLAEGQTATFVDLKSGVLFGTAAWRYDPHGLGARAMRTVRELCEVYRREVRQEAARR